MLRLLIASLLALTVVACGDDGDGGIDAATPDASAPDAGGPDATSACATLCDCATTYCDTRFPDRTACMTECETFDSTALACRIEHCGYAQADPQIHCPHVAGEPGPGTPTACIVERPDAGTFDASTPDGAP
jgi:hypothetical protein